VPQTKEQTVTTDDEMILLKQLCNHICVLAGSNQLKSKLGDTQPFSYSGCIVRHGDVWIWATAGHCFANLKEAEPHLTEGTLECSLVDYLGSSATHKSSPVPFNPMQFQSQWLDRDGIDFVYVVLPHLVQLGLSANRILPLCDVHQVPTSHTEFEGFSLLGIPDVWRKAVDVQGKFGGSTIKPCLLLIGDISIVGNRLQGRILHMGNLESVVGMSGCPLFGYRTQDGSLTYELVGLQQSWDKKETVYVTPWKAGWDAVTRLTQSGGMTTRAS
jgi:hypothetical protein